MRQIIPLLIMIAVHLTALSQSHTFNGRVFEQNGMPVPFATITIKGTKTSMLCNEEGIFYINAKAGDNLVVNAINFQRGETTLTSEKYLKITLTRISNTLPNVVVTNAFDLKREQRTAPYSAQVIPSEILNIIPQTNLNDALVGKIAGAQFRSQSGAKLNSQTFIRIRGGLLLSGDAAPSYIVNGTIVADPYDIDPSTIDNITVLKGANATALFPGAINGAIVITTKKAYFNKSVIHVNQGVTFDRVGLLPKYQNIYAGGGVSELSQYTWKEGDPDEWKALDRKYYNDYTDDASWGPKMKGQEYVPWYAWVPGTKYSFKTARLVSQPDNIKDFWETGITSNTNINFSRSAEGYNTYLSFSKQVINGIIPNSKSDRNIINAAVNFDLNKFLTAGIDFSFNTQKIYGDFNDGFINATTGNFNQWNQRHLDMQIMKELRSLLTPLGTLATWNWHNNPPGYDPADPASFYSVNYWYNSYSFLDNENLSQRRDRLFGNVYIKANINNDLSIKGTVRMDHFNSYFENKKSYLINSAGARGSYSTGQLYQNLINYELFASYNKMIAHNWKLNITAGGSSITYIRKDVNASTSGGLFIPDLYDISNSLYPPYSSNGRLEQKGNALFATGEVEYKKFISASWSLREDWNSTLPETKNKLFSPSAGLAFIPTDLIKAPSWLPFAKIYGSWGKKPLALGIYQTNTSFSINGQWNGNLSMTAGNVIPDQNLKGGLITSYEAGIDVKMFKYRLGLNINYYNETASDQPIQINIDAVSGFTGLVTNIATVKRQGLELTADANILKSKNVSWNLLSSFGWLINNPVSKIIEGQERVQPYGWKSGLDRNAFASAYAVLGKDWGQLIGGGFTRNEQGIPVLDPATGLYVTADNNHDWGSIVPKITGGIQSIFSYKGVTFNFSIDYQFGGKYYSASEYWGAYSGDMEYTAAANDRGKDIRDAASEGGGVHVTGVSALDNKTPVDMYVEAFSYFHQYRSTGIAEPYIHGLSYVKLRELSLGYDLPLKKWHFADKYLQAIKVSLIARNPWLIYSESKYFDPSEISNVMGEEGQLPSVRSYGFNINFTF